MAPFYRRRKRSPIVSITSIQTVLALCLLTATTILFHDSPPPLLPEHVHILSANDTALPPVQHTPPPHQAHIAPQSLQHEEDPITKELTELLRTPAAQLLQMNIPTSPRFVIYRALGNDLPPRHAVGQTYSNLKFILDHEDIDLPDLSRRWYINRIVRPKEELRIVRLLVERREHFTRDEIDYEAFGKVDFNIDSSKKSAFHSTSFRKLLRFTRSSRLGALLADKNHFIIHNNQARNAMLDLGKHAGATYILPWDGNCFLNSRAWREIRANVQSVEEKVAAGVTNVSSNYFTVGMARMTDNDPLMDPEYAPSSANEEPQLIFHESAVERFNEKMPYGHRPKVELLWRLRVKGVWDNWQALTGPWGDTMYEYSKDVPGRNSVTRAGWVARLFSGKPHLENKNAMIARSLSRMEGIEMLLAHASQIWAKRKFGFGEDTLLVYDENQLQSNREIYRRNGDPALNELVNKLVAMADEELHNIAVYTVTDKPKAAPSGDVRDYFSASPFYWPNSESPDGIPYGYRKGSPAPGTELYGRKCEMYDHTRWVSFSRNATVLTLAGYFTGEKRYYDKAARQIRTWFLNEGTRMNPNLMYGQMTFESGNATGKPIGILDLVNIAVVLDAVRILNKEGILSSQDMFGLKVWMREYAVFLSDSYQGTRQFCSPNSHGVLYDVQAASVSAFIGNFRGVLWHTSLARLRMSTQFSEDGSMPREMVRGLHVHRMMYGLEAWVWLARISERIGVDMWNFGANETKESFLKRGMKFCVPYFNGTQWDGIDAEFENMERMLFLYVHGRQKFSDLDLFTEREHLGRYVLPIPRSVFHVSPVMDDNQFTPPFWNLAMSDTNMTTITSDIMGGGTHELRV